MGVQMSSEAPGQGFKRALVYGAPGSTKTASSVTMSVHCPADWTHVRLTELPKRELVSLSDMLWLGFDGQALYGFKQLGVSAPIIDLSTVPSTQLFTKLNEALKDVEAEVTAGRTKTVVVDTVSALDGAMQIALMDQGIASDGNTMTLFGELARKHGRFAATLRRLPVNILFLAHARSAAETTPQGNSAGAMTAATIATKKKDAAGTGEITAEITGKSLNMYRGDGSFVINCRRGSRPVNGKPVQGFWFHMNDQRFDTKSRLILPDVLPADWREVSKYV